VNLLKPCLTAGRPSWSPPGGFLYTLTSFRPASPCTPTIAPPPLRLFPLFFFRQTLDAPQMFFLSFAVVLLPRRLFLTSAFPSFLGSHIFCLIFSFPSVLLASTDLHHFLVSPPLLFPLSQRRYSILLLPSSLFSSPPLSALAFLAVLSSSLPTPVRPHTTSSTFPPPPAPQPRPQPFPCPQFLILFGPTKRRIFPPCVSSVFYCPVLSFGQFTSNNSSDSLTSGFLFLLLYRQ